MPAPGRRPRCPSGSAAAALGRRRRPPRARLGPAGRRRSAGRAELSTAMAEFAALGYRLDAARTEVLVGRALRRAGMRTAAATTLEEARAQLGAMHAAPWAAQAAAELERVAPGRAEGTLTATESRIADLVGSGRRNREIAGELLISVATVEAHLTRIYRKLGRSVAHRARRAHPSDAPTPLTHRARCRGTPLPPAGAASVRSIHAGDAFDVRRGRPTGAALDGRLVPYVNLDNAASTPPFVAVIETIERFLPVLLERPPGDRLQVAAQHRRRTRRRGQVVGCVRRRRPRPRRRAVHQEHDRGDQQARPGHADRRRRRRADDAARAPLQRPAVAGQGPHGPRPGACRRARSTRTTSTTACAGTPAGSPCSPCPARPTSPASCSRSTGWPARCTPPAGGSSSTPPNSPPTVRSTCGPTTIPGTSTSSPCRRTRCTPRSAAARSSARVARSPPCPTSGAAARSTPSPSTTCVGRAARPGGGGQPERRRRRGARRGAGHARPGSGASASPPTRRRCSATPRTGCDASPGIRLYGRAIGRAGERVGVVPFTLEGVDHGLVAAVLGYEHGIGVRSGCFCAHPYMAHLLGLDQRESEAWARRVGARRQGRGAGHGADQPRLLQRRGRRRSCRRGARAYRRRRHRRDLR